MEFPYGRSWTCIECGTEYPEEFEQDECPKDGGHLHRIRLNNNWKGQSLEELALPTDKMVLLRLMHAGERH